MVMKSAGILCRSYCHHSGNCQDFVSENNYQIWLRIEDKALMKYILHKGFVGIDGISLTIGDVVNNRFCVHLIPETRERTTLGKTAGR